MNRSYRSFAALFCSLGMVLALTGMAGCGTDEPSMVAEPNEYEAFQATPEEIQKQADQAQQAAGGR